MPLQVICPGCNARLKAPDTAAGKKTKCPKCQTIVTVPLDAPQAPAVQGGAATKSAAAKTAAENWYMQSPDGSQYGPVSRTELDQWFADGRISTDCQLLKEGAGQWQWASEVFPELEQPAATAPAKPGFDFLGSPDASDPLGIGSASQAPLAPMSSYPAAAPAYGPSYGATPYAASSYGAAYSAASPSYGNPSRTSYRGGPLHPMVVTTAVLHYIAGGLGILACIVLFILGIVVAVGGTSIVAASEEAEAAGIMALASGLGVICLFIVLIPAMIWCVLEVVAAGGMLKRRLWAKIMAIIMAILRLLFALFSLFLAVISLNLISGFFSMLSLAFAVITLVAMFLPEATADFA